MKKEESLYLLPRRSRPIKPKPWPYFSIVSSLLHVTSLCLIVFLFRKESQPTSSISIPLNEIISFDSPTNTLTLQADVVRIIPKEGDNSRRRLVTKTSKLFVYGTVQSSQIDTEDILVNGEHHQGRPGQDGADGADGQDGLPGQDGADGLPGQDGADGQDGQDGADGQDGQQGLTGAVGPPGLNGTDVARAYLTLNNNQLEINVSQVNIIGNLDIRQNIHVHGDWHFDGDEVDSVH